MKMFNTRHTPHWHPRISTIFCVLTGTTAALLVASLAGSAQAANITIDTVHIGNPGNAPDTYGAGYGAVAYEYQIGKYEVTNAQYAAFLNAKAASDFLGLYSIFMGSEEHGGITRSGTSGSYTYAVKANMGNKPVLFVSWFDAIRFTNWLHNGQGSGDTETGAYTLLGGTVIPSNASSITRNEDAIWWLPSEDEWYKAAYYDPALNDGAGGYWLYPTGSNTAPTAVAPPGGTNSANFGNVIGTLTDLGAYVDSSSPYGTYDQGGNALEWNDAISGGSLRALRGGSLWSDSAFNLAASYWFSVHVTSTPDGVGFRVATVHVIPEPSTALLAVVGSVLMLGLRRKSK